jgi:hypothetical protein
LEYLRLALSLEVLRNRTAANPALILQNKHAIEQMSAQLNDMYNFMKQENKLHLQKQQEMADAADAAAEEEAARKSRNSEYFYCKLNRLNIFSFKRSRREADHSFRPGKQLVGSTDSPCGRYGTCSSRLCG